MGITWVVFGMLLASFTHATIPHLNIQLNETTVSGLGGGGYFATQFHVAHSAIVQGAAVFSGGPYYCADGHYYNVATKCSLFPDTIDVYKLERKAEKFEKDGIIDRLENLADDRVYLFHGGHDKTIVKGCSKKSKDFYEYFNASVETNLNNIPCGHGQPVDGPGVECKKSMSPWINNCQYDGYQHALDYVIPNLKPATQANEFNLLTFDQSPYYSDNACFGTTGYIYVPTNCQEMKKCTAHVAFHACNQGLQDVGTDYVKSTGLNGLAEANDIVVMYPQIKKSTVDPDNPNACWDWWGYSETEINPLEADYKYATRKGKQIRAVYRMLENLSSDGLGVY